MLPEKDMRILQELRKNARQTITSISNKTSIPVTTICDRLKRLEKVITKHTTLPDYNKLELNNVFFLLKPNKKNFEEFICNEKSVNSVYKTENDYFLIEVVFSKLIEASLFIEKVKQFGIDDMSQFNVIKEMQRECFLTK